MCFLIRLHTTSIGFGLIQNHRDVNGNLNSNIDNGENKIQEKNANSRPGTPTLATKSLVNPLHSSRKNTQMFHPINSLPKVKAFKPGRMLTRDRRTGKAVSYDRRTGKAVSYSSYFGVVLFRQQLHIRHLVTAIIMLALFCFHF